jgi:hypothetical protein
MLALKTLELANVFALPRDGMTYPKKPKSVKSRMRVLLLMFIWRIA